MVTTTTGLATSFINFTRTSNATVTDSDGKIKWAGHNLLTNSESFDASAWGKYLTTVTANSTAAPNGTTTADTIATTSSNATIYQTSSIPVGTSTFSCWFKAGTLTSVKVVFDGGAATGREATFTLSGSGTAGAVANSSGGAGTFSGGTSSITPLADGWYLCTIANVTTTAAGTLTLLLATSGNVIAWGAHLYRSDLGGMVLNPARNDAYYPTTPPNALGFTEDFSNAVWDKSFFGTTATSNNLIAPNGLQTADLITAINSTNDHVVYQSSGINLAASGVVTGSIYVRANTATFVRCGVVDNASGTDWAGFIVNLSTGAVTNTYTGANASNVTTHTPVSVGNGWYRIGITVTLTASANNLSLRVGPFNAASASPGNYFSVSWAAAGTESIYLWGAQLSDSASLDAYSPVYDAAVTSAAYYAPRLDFDPVTLAARGLLVEEQRTNLLTGSNDFNNPSSWAKQTSGAGITPVVTGGFTDPNGGNTAWRVQLDAGPNGISDYSVLRQASGSWTAPFMRSIWVRSNTGSPQTVAFVATSSASKVTIPTTWTRVEQLQPTSGASQFDLSVGGAGSTPATADILVWNAQVETGTFVTSYIPTGASTATRTADVASVSTQAFPYSSTAGSIVVSYDRVGIMQYSRLFNLGDASENNQVSVLNYNTSQENPYIVSSGSSTIVPGPALPAANTVAKMGFAFRSGDSAYSLNGAAAVANATTFTMAATSLAIGATQVSGQYINGHIRQITYIPRRLSNSELQARTV